MIGALILQITLIALNALFASAEIAVISVSDTRVKMMMSEGNSAAEKLFALKKEPSKFLSTIQVAITLAGFLGSAFAADTFAGPLVGLLRGANVPIPESILNPVIVLLITVILAYFSIVFGELVPKRVAMKNPDGLAIRLAGILNFISHLFAPVVGLLTISTNAVLHVMGVNPDEEDEPVTEDEIRMLVSEGNRKGTISQEENEIIHNVFDFDDTVVEQICTHRRDMVWLSTADGMDVWEQVISENRHTYYPVCGETPDDIIGVLDTKNYFRIDERTTDNVLENAVEKAFLVPETMRVNVLLKDMKKKRRYFAILVDEYGGLSGIATLHDVIEALVGDIDDADEPERPADIVQIDDSSWKIQGCAEPEKVARAIKAVLTCSDCDTFSGYICKTIGRVPRDGEVFSCTADNLSIDVVSVENHMIGECIVHRG